MFDRFGEADKPLVGADMFTAPRTGMLENVGKAVMRGGVRAAQFGALVGGALAPSEDVERSADPDRILPRKEDFFRFIDDTLEPAEKYWSVDPGTLTTAGKIVGAIAELPLQLVGGTAGIVGTATAGTGKVLLDQGVDAGTAAAVAAGTGAVTGAMVALPQVGRTLKETAALALANPVLGAAQDAATAKGLELAGYDQAAAMFDPFDPTARSVDLVLGAVFGGAAHYGRWRQTAPLEALDAIDTVAKRQQQDAVNPFAPGTPEAKAHLDAMGKALDDVEQGRPVDVAPVIRERYTTDRLRSDLVERFNLTDEQAADLVTATVVRRAAVRGMDPDAWLGERLAGIEEGTADAYGALYQSAWHGSPHDFDQFSIDKIGTGEGAQAYGHGLYFAGSREVAEWYREKLSNDGMTYLDGTAIPSGHKYAKTLTNEQKAASFIHTLMSAYGKSFDEAKAQTIAERGDVYGVDVINSITHERLGLNQKKGRLYKVELAPADDEYLLWDKPLSEQSEKVRGALYARLSQPQLDYLRRREGIEGYVTGADLYNMLQRDMGEYVSGWPQKMNGDKAASDYLHSLGIRGIKYLDGSSRGKGDGDYNFVIFNDADVEIVDKLFQGEKGAISWQEDGRAVLHALEAPDFSTAVHELAHLLEADLTATERKQFDRWMHSQVPGAKWSRDQRETFARAFERYLTEGQAPVPELQGVFAKFRDWMLSIYRAIAGSAIDVKLSADTRAAFDRMLFSDLMKRDVAPEVRQLRAVVADHARELEQELVDTWGDEPGTGDQGPGTGGSVPAPDQEAPRPAPLLSATGSPADVLNAFTLDPSRVSPFMADSLRAMARELESSTAEKVVKDGHQVKATVSNAPQWYLDKNRDFQVLRSPTQSKPSTVSALQRAAAGDFARLTPGQQEMVLAAMDDLARKVDAHATELDALQLQVGDRFTSTTLEPRVVVGERQGRLILDNGDTIPMDSTLRVIGEVDQSGRAALEDMAPVDRILQAAGDFEFDDVTDRGDIVRRSAQEALAEARDAVVVERGRKHLYDQAAVCLGLG